MSKALVAYFSGSGVTRKAAEEVARVKSAEPYEILPKNPYIAKNLV